jgi:hypothetical protein
MPAAGSGGGGAAKPPAPLAVGVSDGNGPPNTSAAD